MSDSSTEAVRYDKFVKILVKKKEKPKIIEARTLEPR